MSRKILMLCTVLLVQGRVEPSQDVMKTLTIDFTKALDVCKTEMDLPDTINTDFLNFWKEGYELSDPMTGCAIICLAKKLKLMKPDGTLHHENTQEYAKEHGADESMSKQVADLLQQCEAAAPPADDACPKILGIVKCFKAEIHGLDWAPDVEHVMKEILEKV